MPRSVVIIGVDNDGDEEVLLSEHAPTGVQFLFCLDPANVQTLVNRLRSMGDNVFIVVVSDYDMGAGSWTGTELFNRLTGVDAFVLRSNTASFVERADVQAIVAKGAITCPKDPSGKEEELEKLLEGLAR